MTLDIHEDIYDGYPGTPTKPLTLPQLQVFDLMCKGCTPHFVKSIHDWLASGRTAERAFHATTPAEATVLSLLMKWMDKRAEKKADTIEVKS